MRTVKRNLNGVSFHGDIGKATMQDVAAHYSKIESKFQMCCFCKHYDLDEAECKKSIRNYEISPGIGPNETLIVAFKSKCNKYKKADMEIGTGRAISATLDCGIQQYC